MCRTKSTRETWGSRNRRFHFINFLCSCSLVLSRRWCITLGFEHRSSLTAGLCSWSNRFGQSWKELFTLSTLSVLTFPWRCCSLWRSCEDLWTGVKGQKDRDSIREQPVGVWNDITGCYFCAWTFCRVHEGAFFSAVCDSILALLMSKWNFYCGPEGAENSASFACARFLIRADPAVRLLEKSTAAINQIRPERICAGANLPGKTILHNLDCHWSFNLFDPEDSVLFSKKSLAINFSFFGHRVVCVVLIARAVGLFELGAAVLDATLGRINVHTWETHFFSSCRNPSDEVMTQTAALQSYRTTSDVYKSEAVVKWGRGRDSAETNGSSCSFRVILLCWFLYSPLKPPSERWQVFAAGFCHNTQHKSHFYVRDILENLLLHLMFPASVQIHTQRRIKTI